MRVCVCVHAALFCIAHSYTHVNDNKKATYCCVSVAKFVTRKRQNVS